MDQKDIIVAIDFGSSRSGYAFSFKDSDEIYLSKFEDEKYKGKTLNEVILDNSENVIKYGIKARNHIKQGNLKTNEHFYERIKMNLYNENYIIKASNSLKEINIINLISKILEYLKNHAIENIIKMTEGIKDEYNYNSFSEKIRWVLTVPAIWDEKNKYIMMMAAEKSGVINNNKNLFFALEPESASYYCLQTPTFKKEFFQKPYIVCDLGAGTGDIVCHQKIFDDGIEKIIEKCTPKGGALGSDEINKQFENKVLKLLFGDDAISLLHKNYKKSLLKKEDQRRYSSRYIQLKNRINEFKEGICEEYLDQSCEIDCSIFFKNDTNLNMKNLVDEYNKKCKEEWKITEYGTDEYDKNIYFPYKIMYDITKEIADKISNILLEIISKVSDVSSIFYVGGFCNSKFIVDMIRENIKSQYPNINHISPPNPDNAIINGAVLYGKSPERIKSRKAKYTLGIKASLNWEDKFIKGGKKFYDEKNKIYRCKNSFYKFISINEDVPYDSRLTNSIKMVQIDANFSGGEINIYKSSKPNPLFIDEEEVERIGNFILKVPNNKIKGEDFFFITIQIGGTFLNVSAYHKPSGIRKNMEFKYE